MGLAWQQGPFDPGARRGMVVRERLDRGHASVIPHLIDWDLTIDEMSRGEQP
jgi:hypothetical protein